MAVGRLQTKIDHRAMLLCLMATPPHHRPSTHYLDMTTWDPTSRLFLRMTASPLQWPPLERDIKEQGRAGELKLGHAIELRHPRYTNCLHYLRILSAKCYPWITENQAGALNLSISCADMSVPLIRWQIVNEAVYLKRRKVWWTTRQLFFVIDGQISLLQDDLSLTLESASGLEDIKQAIEQLTMRSQGSRTSYSTSTYSSMSGSEGEPVRRLMRHSSLETINTNVTAADEFVWVDSHNR